VPCLKKKPAFRERLATGFIDVLRANHDEAIAGFDRRKKLKTEAKEQQARELGASLSLRCKCRD
jgi:hypothetical protein